MPTLLRALLGKATGLLTGGRLFALFLVVLLSASTWSFYKGYDIGQAVAAKDAATAVLEATNHAREVERMWYEDQLAVLEESHSRELEAEKANVKVQTEIQTKIVTKEEACEVSKTDPNKHVFSNGFVELYNESVRAANRTTAEADPGGITKTVQADDGSTE